MYSSSSDHIAVPAGGLLTIHAAQFYHGPAKLRDSIRIGRPIRFNSKGIGRFKNFRIESAVTAPLLIISSVKRLKPLTALSGTIYRLASSMSAHMPVV